MLKKKKIQIQTDGVKWAELTIWASGYLSSLWRQLPACNLQPATDNRQQYVASQSHNVWQRLSCRRRDH